MSNTTAATSGTKKKTKQPAPPDLVKAVGALFDIAAKAPSPLQLQAMTRDKLYEMLVLARILRAFKRAHPKGSIIHQPPSKGGKPSEVIVASKPALADRKRFSHFDLFDAAGNNLGEAWTSVEFESLSWDRCGGAPGKAPREARHELDVCVLEPKSGERPAHFQVYAGISCKDVRLSSKENVREALGLRRETALLRNSVPSHTPWLVQSVPATPCSPIFLVSSDLGIRKYASPVDEMGVYIRFVRRPWAAES
ncbi:MULTISPECIES: hypothetical protein [Enterobacteriaceae]|uniref:hypothetical protein n=1 Tax=Enterobacteriaceae TaxID=543 RepID=UPI00191864B1|nr:MULTISPECIES: hypothetical protein [Klebsiella]ELY4797910.1 hypothetical protein [Cronobacter sakazakii]HCA9698635.1 hypothetical protein [Klebsiella variicola subsp. variicola]MEC5749002.1 hypothetical protein [Klebsiella variicola]WPR99983.1 hypothetical protein SM790_06325 [Klebsiella aerogenes]WPS39270.1 hypothetical protein SM910_06330 [Klebsiella aerogenes]